MPNYIYQAKKSPTEVVNGKIEAESEAVVINRLKETGYFPVSVAEEKHKDTSFHTLRAINSRDITIFTRQLSDLLNSGIPLVRSLSIIFSQTENQKMAAIVENIRDTIHKGLPFSEALAQHPRFFSPLYIGMVKAGESSGVLNQVLERLANFIEKHEENKGKIKSAIIYPCFLVLVASVTLFVLFTFILPKFVVMFRDLGQKLPLPTRILIWTSSFLSHYWWILIAILSVILLGLRRHYITPEGKLAFDRYRLKIPLVGKIIRKVEIATFTRTLGSLLQNGVAILSSLRIARATVKNRAIDNEIDAVYEKVAKGARLSDTLADGIYFHPLEINMIAIGEESGDLEGMLLKVAETYEYEIDHSVKSLISLMEPVLIILMGGFIGFIVFSILLPIFQINVLIE